MQHTDAPSTALRVAHDGLVKARNALVFGADEHLEDRSRRPSLSRVRLRRELVAEPLGSLMTGLGDVDLDVRDEMRGTSHTARPFLARLKDGAVASQDGRYGMVEDIGRSGAAALEGRVDREVRRDEIEAFSHFLGVVSSAAAFGSGWQWVTLAGGRF